ncbi:TetR/AcrR family transcriptional regulator [Arthrobacter sp. 2YAF22_2]|uniref:TetR/AcrR family transcriptional regulator n=1 Tax=Arthrobacter sp. 2YAF22_2 TaxID=3233029 RepID=UPI003F903FCF
MTGRGTSAQGPSLRERQKDETWTAIHEAAAAAALEGGLASATVEAVAERAGISRRTFFNYFPTKEDAILGLREPALAEDAVAAFRAGRRTAVGDAAHLMAAAMRAAGLGGMTGSRMRNVLLAVPELITRLKQHVTEVQQLVEPLISERLAGEAVDPAALPADHQGHVEVVKLLAGTILKHAYATELAAVVAGDPGALDRAIDAFRTVCRTEL